MLLYKADWVLTGQTLVTKNYMPNRCVPGEYDMVGASMEKGFVRFLYNFYRPF
jgi:hypothetical protein